MAMKRQREWENITESETQVLLPDSKKDISDEFQTRNCPYLDTVNRQMIDFDSEKLCSQTLSNMNVYVCLVCGKFFVGRGKNTPAFTHSVQYNHYVFMNLESGRSYCLPDLYEIFDNSLSDVQKSLNPKFSLLNLIELKKNVALARDVHGISYLPGFIGLNNLNKTDDVNVVLHLLSHIVPLRDFFLQPELYSLSSSKLVKEFGLLVRKLWSSDNFKSTVSPQEFVQTISLESKKKFAIGHLSEVLELFVWLLMKLNQGLEKEKKVKQRDSVIYEPFQGEIEVITYKKQLVDNFEEEKLLSKVQEKKNSNEEILEDGWVKSTQTTNFTYLSLEIPPCPLFRDSQGGLIIPQIPLFQLLSKFDGETFTDFITKDAHLRKQYRIKSLPRYLIFHLGRFTQNNFSLEKNPTIVTFPVKNLEMKDYLMQSNSQSTANSVPHDSYPTQTDVDMMSIAQMIDFIKQFGSTLHKLECDQLRGLTKTEAIDGKRNELKFICSQVLERIELFSSTKYDLVANVCHESEGSANGIPVGEIGLINTYQNLRNKKAAMASSVSSQVSDDTSPKDEAVNLGHYKIHLPFKSTGQWFELQDLHVTETTPQLIGVSQSYILVYEKKSVNSSTQASDE